MARYFAGISALGEKGGEHDAGLIQVAELPGGRNIGVATNLGHKDGRPLYEIVLKEGRSPGDKWVLESGEFKPA